MRAAPTRRWLTRPSRPLRGASGRGLGLGLSIGARLNLFLRGGVYRNRSRESSGPFRSAWASISGEDPSHALADRRRHCAWRRNCRRLGGARASGARASVALVDRLPRAAGETSFGNAASSRPRRVIPYLFPRAPASIARGALNLDPRAHIRHGALPSIAPAIWRYLRGFDAGGKERHRQGHGPAPVRRGERRAPEFARAAGAEALLRRGGWIKAYRSARGREMAHEGGRGAQALRDPPGPARSGRPCRARAASQRSRDRRRRTTPRPCRHPIPRRLPRATRRCSSSAAGAWRWATREASNPRAVDGWSRPPRDGSRPATS